MKRRIVRMTAAVAVAVVGTAGLAGCAKPPQSFINSRYDFGNVKKVAVWPLENLSGDQQAGERVRKTVVAELLASGAVDVVEPGQVNLALGKAGVQSVAAVSGEDMKRIGAGLGVQLQFLGSVDIYDRISAPSGNYPEVTVSLRAVDVESGTIVWSATQSGGGISLAGRLFGVGAETMSEATLKTVRAAISTLFR